MDERKVKIAVDLFLKNEFQTEYYNNAPTERCKRYISLQFYWSLFTDAKDYSDEKQFLIDTMELEDWRYLHKYAGSNPWQVICKNKIESLYKKIGD